MIALSVKNLFVQSHNKIRLNHLSVDIESGSRVAIIGPNGAGKSTTLQALLRLIPASFQSLQYFDHNIQSLSRKQLAKIIAYVPQTHPNLTISVWDWCVYARFPYQKFGFFLTKKEHIIIDTILAKTELIQYKNTPLSHLSGGERQRAFIAGALCQETPIIFLDEPTNFLDPKQAHEILKLIHDISIEMNKTIISVTHDINEVMHYFTHCLAIQNGQKLFYGQSHEVIHSDNLFSLYNYRFTEATSEQGVIFW
ncbi:ABC transporter ATP-binding protein [Wohlfahrtiimonas larvae]|uniref:ABC transporter ATP-binding protein n=1 Tax=Wohlfahrtiimonas larvae TaxID=1157986 RepID=A0ABP9MJ81_9GAMM|nr:ABC transporter ATP-binding protein [Wohlfahrtiimonas larvae]